MSDIIGRLNLYDDWRFSLGGRCKMGFNRRWDRWLVRTETWRMFRLSCFIDDVVLCLAFLLFLLGRERVPKLELQCYALDWTSSLSPAAWTKWRAFRAPRFDWNIMRLDAGSQVGGGGKTIFESDSLSVRAWLTASSAGASHHPLSPFTSSIGVDDIESFDPAHLTMRRMRR